MKRVIIAGLMFLLVLGVYAAEPQNKFSPEKFQADLEQFITKEASLTPQEATKFFPLYREMQTKQRRVYNEMMKLGQNKPAQEDECKKAIQKRDELELELKRILQTYHNKFFKVIPASKVFDVSRAEDRFFRHSFRNWGQGGRPGARPGMGRPGGRRSQRQKGASQ
jgi:hypothetical protein